MEWEQEESRIWWLSPWRWGTGADQDGSSPPWKVHYLTTTTTAFHSARCFARHPQDGVGEPLQSKNIGAYHHRQHARQRLHRHIYLCQIVSSRLREEEDDSFKTSARALHGDIRRTGSLLAISSCVLTTAYVPIRAAHGNPRRACRLRIRRLREGTQVKLLRLSHPSGKSII